MIEWIKELRSTERGRALFKLILYMIFFGAVLFLVVFTNAVHPPKKASSSSTQSSPVEKPSESPKEKTYFDKQEVLYTGQYDFTYRIESDKIVEYIGEYNAGHVIGYRETDDDLIKYSIEEGVTYLHSFGSKTEYDELYLTYDAGLFDFKNLFKKLNSSTANIEKNGVEKRYTYQNIDRYTYIISTDEECIDTIEIFNESTKYEFAFDY